MIRALSVLLLLALPAAAQTTLTVEGRGEVAAVPDMATVSIGVTREADTAQAALRLMSEAADAVVARLSAEGVAARDVQTGELSLRPRYRREAGPDGRPEVDGHVASTRLTVRARDLDGLGALLDVLVGEGADGLSGPAFALSDPRPAEDAARRAAFGDAMAKADLYAGAAGLSVGRIVSIREARDAVGPPVMMERMAMAADVPVERGEVTTAITVTVEVALE